MAIRYPITPQMALNSINFTWPNVSLNTFSQQTSQTQPVQSRQKVHKLHTVHTYSNIENLNADQMIQSSIVRNSQISICFWCNSVDNLRRLRCVVRTSVHLCSVSIMSQGLARVATKRTTVCA